MKDGAWKRLAGGFTAWLATAGLGVAFAQQPQYPQVPAQPAGYSAAQPSQDDAIRQLYERLDKIELENRALKAQYQTKFASFENDLATELADKAPAKKDDKGPKEVPIIDKPSNIKLTGKLFIDHYNYAQSLSNKQQLGGGVAPANLAAGDIEDTDGLRLARIAAQGDIYENVDFKIEVDFAGQLFPRSAAGLSPIPDQETAFKDVYITVKYLPILGNVRVGNFKEPFGLDELTGDEFTMFMERSLTDFFFPARHIGIMSYDYINDNKDYSYYIGTFRDGYPSNGLTVFERSDENDWGVTARLAATPYYDEISDGRCLIHLGAAVDATAVQTNNADLKGFTAFPENRTSSATVQLPFASTGNIPATDYTAFDLEAAVVNGPWSVQSEYCGVSLNQIGANNTLYFDSFYVQGSYFLTGENRGYDREFKRFSRVKVYEPFFRVRTCDDVCTGWGAWELAARYSYINLTDLNINGGRINDSTLGVNWYLNSYCRVMFEYIHSELDRTTFARGPHDGEADIFGTRFQIDF